MQTLTMWQICENVIVSLQQLLFRDRVKSVK